VADSFVDLVRETFGFLASEFGFTVTNSEEDAIRYLYSGVVTLDSQATSISITADKGNPISPYIVRAKDKAGTRWRWPHGIYLDWIVEYKTTPPPDRRVLLSTSPEDDERARQIENRSSSARAISSGEDRSGEMEGRARRILAADAELLRKHCDQILKGDFAEWLQLHEYNRDRFVSRQLRMMRHFGKASSVEEIEATSGETLEYLNALRQEYEAQRARSRWAR
jgi:hypothetical protein